MCMSMRLPRRFDAVMKSLRELSSSKSERVRLQAALRMSDILLEHQRSQERVAIALERAAVRRAEAEPPEATGAVRESAEEFIARVTANRREGLTADE